MGSAFEVALTETLGGFGTTEGAVYSPWVVMVPQLAPLHPAPERLQRTEVSPLPVTVAVNCCCPLTGTVAVVGVTTTLMVGLA